MLSISGNNKVQIGMVILVVLYMYIIYSSDHARKHLIFCHVSWGRGHVLTIYEFVLRMVSRPEIFIKLCWYGRELVTLNNRFIIRIFYSGDVHYDNLQKAFPRKNKFIFYFSSDH